MITKKSRLGFALVQEGEKNFVTGYPKASETYRFWETAGEFQTYLQEAGLGAQLRMLSEATVFYAVGTAPQLEEFLSELEEHFQLDDES